MTGRARFGLEPRPPGHRPMRALCTNAEPCRRRPGLVTTIFVTLLHLGDSAPGHRRALRGVARRHDAASIEQAYPSVEHKHAGGPRGLRFSTPTDHVRGFGRGTLVNHSFGLHHLDADLGNEALRGDLARIEFGEDPLDPVLKKMKEEWEKQLEEAAKNTKKATRPLMSAINAMRAELCWQRPELWTHEKCLQFLGLMCATSSTGVGTCRSFRESAEEHCREVEGEAEAKICDMLKQLRVVGSEHEEEEADGEDQDAKDKADLDGDGILNDEDLFPHDAKEWGDLDKDGIGDNTDEDIDGDGAVNKDDNLPRDPKEWNDFDSDGVGDNSDADRDGDGMGNELDKEPDDPTKQGDGKQAPPPVGGDRDKDGVVDSIDAFPDDPKEWHDQDGDGIGDNSDEDIDGDGYNNKEDSHPYDPSRYMHDRDGDGVADDKDEFPDDPAEWKDSDKDGVGDNADPAPYDASCWTSPCPHEGSSTPEPSKGGSADKAGEAGEPSGTTPVPPDLESKPTTEPRHDWANRLNKVERGLPPDGYDEHTPGLVEHDDMETMTRDWRKEWPQLPESDMESFRRICAENPRNTWCRRFGFSL